MRMIVLRMGWEGHVVHVGDERYTRVKVGTSKG
jgi:hypothetical protein